MKALIYKGPNRLEMGEMPKPEPGPGQVLVRVHHCGICGSDMHAWHGHDERRNPPLILGHEIAGMVEGGGMDGKVMDGKRVTVNPLVGCKKCVACKQGRENLCPQRQLLSLPPCQGGFGEYIVIAEQNLIEVPDNIPLEIASLCEPLACGWHAVRLAEKALFIPLEKARALVIGGGAIGVGAALALQCQGSNNITLLEPNKARAKTILSTCDFTVVDDQASLEAEFDLVIDAVGYEATRKIVFEKILPGGVIMHIGLGDRAGGVDVRYATLQEITFIGTYTYSAEDFDQTAKAIFGGKLGKFGWQEAERLENGQAAFEKIAAGKAASPKIVLTVEA